MADPPSHRTTNADISQEIGGLNVRVTVLEQSVADLRASQEETKGQISTLSVNVGSALVSIGRLEEKIEGVQRGIATTATTTWWILGVALSTLGAIVAGVIVPRLG